VLGSSCLGLEGSAFLGMVWAWDGLRMGCAWAGVGIVWPGRGMTEHLLGWE
jgi:hypothetical protein